MTYKKLMKLFKHYKDDYDFKLTKTSYQELEDIKSHDGEFIAD